MKKLLAVVMIILLMMLTGCRNSNSATLEDYDVVEPKYKDVNIEE